MILSMKTKIALSVLPALILFLAMRKINTKKADRRYQFLTALIAPIYALLSLFFGHWLYTNFYEIMGKAAGLAMKIQNADAGNALMLIGGLIFYNSIVGINFLIGLVWILIRLIVRYISWLLKINDVHVERLTDRWYEYDSDFDMWFLKERWRDGKTALDYVSYVALGLTISYFIASFQLGTKSGFWIEMFPMAALIAVTEIFLFLDGYTRTDYEKLIGGEAIGVFRYAAYDKLRHVYEKLLPQPLLLSFTGSEFFGKKGATEKLHNLSISDDPLDRLAGEYFTHLYHRTPAYDVDLIDAATALVKKQSVVIFNPFYRDLSNYLLLPVIHQLLNDRKVLVIIGRRSMKEDVQAWLQELLRNYSGARALWRVAHLSEMRSEAEVGILSFSQIYDPDVVQSNAEFFAKTELVLMLEPSNLITTSQTGLGIIVEKLKADHDPVFCICDREVDGLVDTLSHVLQTSITTVAAAPAPRGVYTGIGWASSGDYIRQKMFDKESRYLGNGVELAAVALKNQVRKVRWYSEEKVPVRDIRWLAGQHYAQICKYAHLPSQQSSLEERLQFSSNLWETRESGESFVIVEDEFCNLFSTLRTYLSRGTEQSFVNVIAENYLMRDYMRCNRQVFMSDAHAVPSIAPHYAKTERNTVIRLILMMAQEPVEEGYIAHELSILGYSTRDVYRTLTDLIDRYTYVGENVISVVNRARVDENMIPERINYYSISRAVFDERFADTLKDAYFVVEDEKLETETIDARLFEHITQLVMPGQYVVYDGKYYRVHAVSPQIGCVLHRAADLYDNRHYYRQLRTYEIGEEKELVSTRTVMDLKITQVRTSVKVSSTGYLDMRDNNDLRSARSVDLSEDPSISSYQRAYKNKNVLMITLPEADPWVCYTLALLMSELFRTTFGSAWPYLAVLTGCPQETDGMLEQYIYKLGSEPEEGVIYIIEDSDMDLGLLEAVESNLSRIFMILTDYINWHIEKMREPEYKDPEPQPVDIPKTLSREKEGFLRRLGRFIQRTLHLKSQEEKEKEKKQAEERERAEREAAEKAEQEKREAAERARTDVPEDLNRPENAEASDTEAAAAESNELYFDEEDETAPAEDQAEEDQAHTEKSGPEEPAAHSASNGDMAGQEGAALSDTGVSPIQVDGVPDDLDLIMDKVSPIHKTRYQKECYLLFGFNEIDGSLQLDKVLNYLRQRGWATDNPLMRARTRDAFSNDVPDLTAALQCDFCGMPLNGVSYERLADGRIRCNDCAASAVNSVEEFRELYRKIVMLMETYYDISLRVPMTVVTTDARTIAKHTGEIYDPKAEFNSRTVGFAQKDKDNTYSLMIENGSPRMAVIDTITHEMTHVWQFQNWDERAINRHYGKGEVRLAVYEGMAVWSAVQMMYMIGETSYARLQEAVALSREDIYGIGFKLYMDRYGMKRDGTEPPVSPFKEFPPL